MVLNKMSARCLLNVANMALELEIYFVQPCAGWGIIDFVVRRIKRNPRMLEAAYDGWRMNMS